MFIIENVNRSTVHSSPEKCPLHSNLLDVATVILID